MKFKIDPKIKSLIPPLREAELEGLEEKILEHGCLDSLKVWDGILLDGHHRFEICQKHGISYETEEMEFPDREAAELWVFENQVLRRNLSAKAWHYTIGEIYKRRKKPHGGLRVSYRDANLRRLVHYHFRGDGCRFAVFNYSIKAYICHENVALAPWQDETHCANCEQWEYDDLSGLVDDLLVAIQAGEVVEDGKTLTLNDDGDVMYLPSDLLEGPSPAIHQSGVLPQAGTEAEVAQEYGVGRGTVQRSKQLADAIDKIAESTDDSSVRTDLLGDEIPASEASIREVGKMTPAEQRDVIEAVKTGKAENLTEAKRQIQTRKKKGKATFNYQTGTNIKWAKWSWNPYTGCIRGCEFCYAADIANRYYDEGFEPTFHESRLDAPFNTKIPQSKEDEPGIHNVFLGSMTDFFGDGIPDSWINKVLAVVRRSPKWQYLVLTKRPGRIKEFAPFPSNLWIGVTVHEQAALIPALEAFGELRGSGNITFISFEPLQSRISFKLSSAKIKELHLIGLNGKPLPALHWVKWVIVGGRSRNTKMSEFHPPFCWVEDIQREARKAKCALYFKANLKSVPEEYPE